MLKDKKSVILSILLSTYIFVVMASVPDNNNKIIK